MKKRVYELESNDCRWPLGHNADGEQLFCCRVAPDGLPYCPPHGRMSTASGNAPSPMNPWGEPEIAHAHRGYLDQSAASFRREQGERELDLVELLEKTNGDRRIEGHTQHAREAHDAVKQRREVDPIAGRYSK